MYPVIRPKTTDQKPKLRVVRPEEMSGSKRYWLINGDIASIQCWSDSEFAQLVDPPMDAVHYPEGVWILLQWN